MNGDTETEEPLQGIPADVEVPEGPQQPIESGAGQSADVRLEYYGRNFNEHNRDANFGPEGIELQDHHVAIAPDTAENLGLKLGDWVWVGPQMRQYMDKSYRAPDQPNSNVVEVRDYPADGRTTLRKATPEEVESFAPSMAPGGPLTAMQAASFTGKSPENITAGDVNQAIQGVPQRALIAGEPTAATFEAAAEEPTGGADMSDGMVGGGGGGDEGVVTGDIGTPNPAHSHFDGVDKNGTRIYDGGAIKYHPNTDTLEWNIAGRTFLKTGEYGKVTSFPSSKIWRNPDTGEIFNVATGTPQRITLPGQSPTYNPNLSSDENLRRLSPQDADMVRKYASYKLPMTTRFGRLSPEFSRLRGYVNALNPDIDPRNYQVRQTTMNQMASGQNGSPGQQLNSFNQALIHAGNLWDIANKGGPDGKGLPEGKFVRGNQALNWIRTNWGDPTATEFNAQAHIFATEVERAITSGVPSVTAVNELEQKLNAAQSKAQIEGIIRDVFMKTIGGGMERINFGYKRNMGVDYPTEKLIAPEAADSLQKFGINKLAGRDLTAMQQRAGGGAAEQAAIAELTRQGKLVNPDTIKQAIKIMQGQQ